MTKEQMKQTIIGLSLMAESEMYGPIGIQKIHYMIDEIENLLNTDNNWTPFDTLKRQERTGGGI